MGMSIVVCTDNDQAAAQRIADELAAQAPTSRQIRVHAWPSRSPGKTDFEQTDRLLLTQTTEISKGSIPNPADV
jgi:hypothetical protein